MNCPHCPVTLKPAVHRNVELDQCPRCAGIWFDRDELAKFNRFDSDFPLRPESKISGKITQLKCPRCKSILSSVAYTPEGSLKIERCISCKGVWLGSGEIKTIRGLLTKKLRLNRARRALDATTRREQEMWEAHMAGVAEAETEETLSRGQWFFMFLTRLPLEVHNPVRRFPKATVALMLTAAGMFGLQYYAGLQAVVSLSFIPSRFLHLEQTYGLITTMFLHANPLHLAGNLYFLYTFGDNVEDFLGPPKFIGFYFLCGIGATLAHFAADIYSPIPVIGASGAISGILGAYMLVFPRRKIYWFILIWPIKLRAVWYGAGWAALQFVNAAYTDNSVAWFAHIGGFVAGLALTKAYLVYRTAAQS